MPKLSHSDKAVHDQFSRFGRNAKEWMNKCVLMLPLIEKQQIWEKKGFGDIYEYARKIAGMSRNKVNEGLRILRKTENLPAIRKVIETKGIFCVKPIINLADEKTDVFWALKASEMSKNTLETYVKDYKIEKMQDDRPGAGSQKEKGLYKAESKVQLSIKLDADLFATLKEIKGDEDWNELMRKLLNLSRKGLEEERIRRELKIEKSKPVKSNNHTVSGPIRKYIKNRSAGICEHKNCQKPGKNFHHIEPFSLKKEHNPDKILFLCEEHHKIVHLGYIDDSNPQSLRLIEKLEFYDIKNLVNRRTREFNYTKK